MTGPGVAPGDTGLADADLEDAQFDDQDPVDGREAGEWRRFTGFAIAAWSLIGLIASLALSIDKIRLLEDPSYVPSCNFNPLLSCGSVMSTEQAAILGFPNPFLGLIGFAAVLTLGALVLAGTRLPTPILLGGALGSLVGVGFVHWLIFQSLYRIEALCPWCMVVWAVTIPLTVWFALAAAARVGSPAVRRMVETLRQWRFSVVAVWYLAIASLIVAQFWDYWSSLID